MWFLDNCTCVRCKIEMYPFTCEICNLCTINKRTTWAAANLRKPGCSVSISRARRPRPVKPVWPLQRCGHRNQFRFRAMASKHFRPRKYLKLGKNVKRDSNPELLDAEWVFLACAANLKIVTIYGLLCYTFGHRMAKCLLV